MKKTDLIKGILLILLSVVLIGTSTVFAADDEEYDDEFDDIMNFSSGNTTTSTPGNTAGNTTGNVADDSVLNLTGSTGNTTANNTVSSIYDDEEEEENSSLPKTGVEDSLPTMVLIVIFGISAVYAYKKIREYNNL